MTLTLSEQIKQFDANKEADRLDLMARLPEIIAEFEDKYGDKILDIAKNYPSSYCVYLTDDLPAEGYLVIDALLMKRILETLELCYRDMDIFEYKAASGLVYCRASKTYPISVMYRYTHLA